MRIETSAFSRVLGLLLVGAITPMSAQEGRHGGGEGRSGQNHSSGQENRPQRGHGGGEQRPENQGRQDSPQPQHHGGRNAERQPQQRSERPSRHEQRGGGEQGKHEGQHRSEWEGRRAHDWKSEHRDWRERGGYRGYHIPEARYRGHFGPGHAFHLRSYPMRVIGGFPSFQYGGVWISVLDPWPEYWSNTWYDDDDVYIEYANGGYYMQNLQYPRDRISISIRLN